MPTAVVTGGSTGIGAATVRTLARRGYRVAFTYLKSEKEAQALAAETPHVFAYRADATSWEEMRQFAEEVRHRFGKIEALVANAGGLPERKTLEESDLNYWKEIIDLNLTSAYIATRLFVPMMDGGAVIYVSSVAAHTGGGRGAFAYAAAKAGLLGLTRALAKELGKRGIRLIAVLPGLVDTSFHQKAKTGDIHQWAANTVYLQRVAKPEEIAEVVAFLIEASYITGAFIDVNGGW